MWTGARWRVVRHTQVSGDGEQRSVVLLVHEPPFSIEIHVPPGHEGTLASEMTDGAAWVRDG